MSLVDSTIPANRAVSSWAVTNGVMSSIDPMKPMRSPVTSSIAEEACTLTHRTWPVGVTMRNCSRNEPSTRA